MKMFKINIAILLIIAFALLGLATMGNAQSEQQTLNQYISDLQKNPTDTALRGKIIKFVQEMKQAPKVPDEVLTHEGAAEYAFKNAKTNGDFEDAAKEYEKALLIAPWLATDYFNCGVAYEKSRKFDAAIRNFSLYLIAAPSAQDANDVRKRIGGLKYAASKPVRETQDDKGSQSSVSNVANTRFTLESGVIYDLQLNLQWVPANGLPMNHYQAGEYVRTLSIGEGGWRLPTRAELKSLYDTSKLNNIDPVFSIDRINIVWTSELSERWGSSHAWWFFFRDGSESQSPRNNTVLPSRVLAVRSRR